jgi:hypothetical protein
MSPSLLNLAEIDTPLTKPTKLFGRLEAINLYLPFTFILIVAFFLIRGTNLNLRELDYLFIAQQYIFLNATHAFFTFSLIVAVPEVRHFMKLSLKQHSWWVFLGLVLIFSTILVAYFNRQYYTSPRLLLLPKVIFTYLIARHGIGQTFGLSMQYNAKITPSLNIRNSAAIATLEARERKFYKYLLSIVVCGLIFNKFLPSLSAIFFYFLSFAAFLLSIFFYWIVLQYPGKVWLNKKIYFLRIFLYPFSFISHHFIIAIGCLHGVEYLF